MRADLDKKKMKKKLLEKQLTRRPARRDVEKRGIIQKAGSGKKKVTIFIGQRCTLILKTKL